MADDLEKCPHCGAVASKLPGAAIVGFACGSYGLGMHVNSYQAPLCKAFVSRTMSKAIIQAPCDEFIRKCEVVRVVDGDTIDVKIDLGWDISMVDRIRLLGYDWTGDGNESICKSYSIDTPEVRGPERVDGIRYREYVETWCETGNSPIWLHSIAYKAAKYGRTLGDLLTVDGNSLCSDLRKKLKVDGLWAEAWDGTGPK